MRVPFLNLRNAGDLIVEVDYEPLVTAMREEFPIWIYDGPSYIKSSVQDALP